MLMLCFLAAIEMKPLTLWACQSVAFMISARVAPFARPIISRIFAPLLAPRGVVALRSDLAGAFSGAACAPCSATVAAFVVGFCVRHGVLFILFTARASRMTIHHSVSTQR